MNSKYSRRFFITTGLSGVGAIALSKSFPQNILPEKKRNNTSGNKKLFATTDFSDNIVINLKGSRYETPVFRNEEYWQNHKCFMDRSQLDGLHRILASAGVTRHQWIVDTMWNLYEDYPHKFDLLEEATKSAHVHGLEFYAEFKPFEGGGFGIVLPHTMPCPKGTGTYSDICGIFPRMRRFVADNPTLNLQRKAGTYKCDEPVSAIRLVKSDNRPTRIKAEHLSIWTSPTNNQFVPYSGPIQFQETIEKRFRFPYWRESRIIHLKNLEIPAGHKYFLIKCSLADEKGDFSNEKGNIVELVNTNGKILPHTIGAGPVRLEDHYESFFQSKLNRLIIPYLRHPEVLPEIDDLQRMKEHYRDFYNFNETNLTAYTTLDSEGILAVACGKPEFIPGHLHPIYPEVRKHWLDVIRFCLDRGVDGINIRASNHTSFPETYEYGFNEPVMKASRGKTDFATISKINGDAYTLFLREVKELVKSRGKSLTVHLETELLIPDNRPGKMNSYPFNFEWQWETWVQEIADEFEIRGIYQLRPWNFKKAVDTFSAVANAANKPIYLQGDFHGMSFEGPFFSSEAEIDFVNNHSGLDGYVFYETANITRVNNSGEVEESSEIINLLKQYSKKL